MASEATRDLLLLQHHIVSERLDTHVETQVIWPFARIAPTSTESEIEAPGLTVELLRSVRGQLMKPEPVAALRTGKLLTHMISLAKIEPHSKDFSKII